jgi:hypothetical protein
MVRLLRYAFTAIYFAHAFFPSDSPTVQLLNTAGVFAAGFLMPGRSAVGCSAASPTRRAARPR